MRGQGSGVRVSRTGWMLRVGWMLAGLGFMRDELSHNRCLSLLGRPSRDNSVQRHFAFMCVQLKEEEKKLSSSSGCGSIF